MIALNRIINPNANPAEGFDLQHTPDEQSDWKVKWRRRAMISKTGGKIYDIVETLAVDQWDNYSLVYHTLLDGDTYQSAHWVRPSVWEKHNGWSYDLFNYYRGLAYEAFYNAERNIGHEKLDLHINGADHPESSGLDGFDPGAVLPQPPKDSETE